MILREAKATCLLTRVQHFQCLYGTNCKQKLGKQTFYWHVGLLCASHGNSYCEQTNDSLL